MDLEALRVFVAVAEQASFTRAADNLGITKASASLRVQALEAALGVPLLQRTTRTVRMTMDGEQLLPRAKQLVGDADEVAALFQGARDLRGTVRVDLPATFAREHVIPRLPEFLAAHPLLDVQLSTTDRRVDVVREGFDVVLSIGNLAPSGLTAQRLGALEIVNCASPAYVNKYGMPRSIEELADHLIVGYAMRFDASAPGFEYRTAGGTYVEQPMRAAVTVNNADAYRVACLAGLGIIQSPRIGVATALAEGSLVEVLPEFPSEPMPVSLVHPHGRSVPKRVRAMLTWLAAVIRPKLG